MKLKETNTMTDESKHESQEIYSATFIFCVKKYDSEFEDFNAQIKKLAEKNPGFIGSSSWQNQDNSDIAAVYYWKSLDDLQVFSKESVHLKAKEKYKQWYSGYQVIISKIIKTYGDGELDYITNRMGA